MNKEDKIKNLWRRLLNHETDELFAELISEDEINMNNFIIELRDDYKSPILRLNFNI